MPGSEWSTVANWLLLGQLQGWLLAGVLLTVLRHRRDSAQMAWRSLIALLLSLALALNLPLLQELQQLSQWPRLSWLLAGLPLLFGPLLLVHVAHQTGQVRWVSGRRAGLHLLLPLSFYLVTFASTAPVTVSSPVWSRLYQLSFVSYCLLALFLLHRYERALRERFAELRPYSLPWLRAFILAALTLTLLLALAWLTELSEQKHQALLALALTLLIIGAGFYGLYKMPAAVSHASDLDQSAQQRTAGSKAPLLAEPELQVVLGKLEQLPGQTALLFDHNLDLDQLAAALRISPHQLSWTLNQVLKTPFYDYINGLRVQAVQQRLSDPAQRQTTILDLALACGFANKSTFNKSFKAVSGMTPSAWRAANQSAQPPSE